MSEHVQPTSNNGKMIDIGEVTLYVDDQGAGDPVVLLHGGIMDHQSWGNQIPALAQRFRVISPDTRGHGRSTDTDEPFSYRQFALDAISLLDALGIERAKFVGFSDGGDTAIILGTDFPERVTSIVLIGTPYNTSNYPAGTTDHFAAITPAELYEMVGEESPFGEVMRKAEALYEPAAWVRFWRKLVNETWPTQPNFDLGDLEAVQAPTLVIHAANEPFFDISHSQEIVSAIPRAQLAVIPDASHTSPQEQPQAVNAALMDFLTRN